MLVASSNAVNITDGLDGLAGGLSTTGPPGGRETWQQYMNIILLYSCL